MGSSSMEQQDEAQANPQNTSTNSPTVESRGRTPDVVVFMKQALGSLASDKEGSRNGPLQSSLSKALSYINTNTEDMPPPILIYEPLHLACSSRVDQLVITSLNCFGKLISYSYFLPGSATENVHGKSNKEENLMDHVIDTICDCLIDSSTDERIQMQILRALANAVLNEKEPRVMIHEASLLKAVRTVYNCSLIGRIGNMVGSVALGTFTQIVHAIFSRINPDIQRNVSSEEELVGIDTAVGSAVQEEITLQSFEKCSDLDRVDEGQQMESGNENLKAAVINDVQDIYIKDALLVFRSICKLSSKHIAPEVATDVTSTAMRSKLLTLQTIHTILHDYINIFKSRNILVRFNTTSPTTFLDATKRFLCLTLSRNAFSTVARVFELSIDIFWLMIQHLRGLLKKELEVFLNEMVLHILELKASSPEHKEYLVTHLLIPLCREPQILVEIYLNYDCDNRTITNIYERMVNVLSKLALTTVVITSQQKADIESHNVDQNLEPMASSTAHGIDSKYNHTNIPFSAPLDYKIKLASLQCLITILESLALWSKQGLALQSTRAQTPGRNGSGVFDSGLLDKKPSVTDSQSSSVDENDVEVMDELVIDDPSEFENLKQRKNLMLDGIQKFNYKPNLGIDALIHSGFIKSNLPQDVAHFLFTTEGLNKVAVGEYLGESDEFNVSTMHAFVDLMDFTNVEFVDALRNFLQHFRLPGEAQKIDRFVLKFGERYCHNNPNAFANAEVAYVLAYSVILLNSDQHNPQVKRSMTCAEFIKNNKGINDGHDLSEEYLTNIFDSIRRYEIVLQDEQSIASLTGSTLNAGAKTGIGYVLSAYGRDLRREAYIAASEEMATKTEALFKVLISDQKNFDPSSAKFFVASHFEHAGPMFETVWMPILAGLSGPLQNSESSEIIVLCLMGFRIAIQLVCLFDLELARKAFVPTLAKFTFLNNVNEMHAKHVEVINCLLSIALMEGNYLKDSWIDVLLCVSQLERIHLIQHGKDDTSATDDARHKTKSLRDSLESTRASLSISRSVGSRSLTGQVLSGHVAELIASSQINSMIDRIFEMSAKLSGDAILSFVQALSEVSWQEIMASGNDNRPRLFSLQKIVEISYFNMDRIRFEWTAIWLILGKHFNQVGCHANRNVVFFALDSLRQLSMQFFEIEELPHFKFQKDFLKPYEHIMEHNDDPAVKELILQCLNQMIQARSEKIKSGWRTMFAVFALAASHSQEAIVAYAYNNIQQIVGSRLIDVILQGSFADLAISLTAIAKNSRFQKLCFQSLDTMKQLVPAMIASTNLSCDSTGNTKLSSTEPYGDAFFKYWFPILFGLHDIIMTAEDLEIRSRALNYLFSILTEYGDYFSPECWDVICTKVLFPLFSVLRSNSQLSQFTNNEDMSVWLSTTLVEALRNLIELFNHYFITLERMMGGFLTLLNSCICQENDTLARIGSSCFKQLVVGGASKFTSNHWQQVAGAIDKLFETTTAYRLFNPDSFEDWKMNLGKRGYIGHETIANHDARSVNSSNLFELASQNDTSTMTADDTMHAMPALKKEFKQIIIKCVLQMLIIEMVSQILSVDDVYKSIPCTELLLILDDLKKSYRFAKQFNSDKAFRSQLMSMGFMKQPPNLLKQESTSAAVYINVTLRMYNDPDDGRLRSRDSVEESLLPLCVEIIDAYNQLDETSQQRNIAAWRPTIVDVIHGFTSFTLADFRRHMPGFYPHAVALMSRQTTVEMRLALQSFFCRIGEDILGYVR